MDQVPQGLLAQEICLTIQLVCHTLSRQRKCEFT